ncbi:MAG: sulfite exporter TauE/SafE family protein [Deltaproteobacteria bacterium]|nr:sulfite exporter TauE/SafE family protein [Deltaproteobacteria bacterium]
MTAWNPEIYLGFMALGLGVGAFGTLIGAGGGFVLMPVLLLLYPHESPENITSISLAVVFLNALSGSEAYARMRRIDYRSGLLFALATIPGAVLGALNTSLVPRRLFDVIFGVLLVAGAALLAFKPRQAHNHPAAHNGHLTARHLVEADGQAFDYAFNPVLGVGISLGVGYLSSFLGIGGGIIHVPALVYLLGFPVHVATATSHFILVVMALTGTLVHVLESSFAHGTHHMISLAIGVVAGAQLGALLSNHLKGGWIIRSLALALGLVGVRIIMQVW